jgi:hypothetical protein
MCQKMVSTYPPSRARPTNIFPKHPKGKTINIFSLYIHRPSLSKIYSSTSEHLPSLTMSSASHSAGVSQQEALEDLPVAILSSIPEVFPQFPPQLFLTISAFGIPMNLDLENPRRHLGRTSPSPYDKSSFVFLGPIGDPNPTNLINL